MTYNDTDTMRNKLISGKTSTIHTYRPYRYNIWILHDQSNLYNYTRVVKKINISEAVTFAHFNTHVN